MDTAVMDSTSNDKGNATSLRGVSFQPGHWVGQEDCFAAQASAPRAYPSGVADMIRLTLQKASEINKSGTAALAADSVQEAASYFRSALEYLELLHMDLQRWQFQEQMTFAMATNSNRARVPVVVEEIDVPGCQDEYLYVYNKAFDFLPDLLGRTPAQEDFDFQVAFYSATVAFNIALCLHRRGTAEPSLNEECLTHAVHFYDVCMKKISWISVLDYSDKVMMLMLTLWNNQAHIYYQLQSYASASEIWEGVRQLAARMVYERQATLSADDHAIIFEYVLNVAVLRVPTIAPCA